MGKGRVVGGGGHLIIAELNMSANIFFLKSEAIEIWGCHTCIHMIYH